MMLRKRSSSTGTATMRTLTYGLAGFSIALGMVELRAPRPIARKVGLQGREPLLRLYGLRELATGFGILANRDNPAPWIWARVVGDIIDLGTLAEPLRHKRKQPLLPVALAAVTAVGLADLFFAGALSREHRLRKKRRAFRSFFDYSDRSGLPKPAEQMRGVAMRMLSETVH